MKIYLVFLCAVLGLTACGEKTQVEQDGVIDEYSR